jgi:hypothetical protein
LLQNLPAKVQTGKVRFSKGDSREVLSESECELETLPLGCPLVFKTLSLSSLLLATLYALFDPAKDEGDHRAAEHLDAETADPLP